MENTGLGNSRIGQIAINVHDLERAITFYRDVLGMNFLFQAPPNMAFFICGDVRLLLGLPDKPEFDHPASIIYYRVDDIHATCSALSAKGVTFEHEPALVHKAENHDLWIAFFRDTEDNLLALMSEVSKS